MPGYMSVYSCVSPAIAAFRLSRGRADRQPGRRIADGLEVLEMAMRVAGLALGRRAEHRRDVVEAFDVGLGGEIQIAPVGLRLAGKRVLQVLFRLTSLEIHDITP